MKQHIRFITVTGMLLVLFLTNTPLAAKEPELPAPTGPYQIGRTSRYWIDETRFDFLTLVQQGDLQPGSAVVHTASLVKAEAKLRSATVETTQVGQFLKVTEIKTKWAHIEYDKVKGWVDSGNLINVDPSVANDPNHKRQLVIRIWYPADVPTGATPVTYLEDLSGPMAQQAQKLWELSGADPEDQKLINLKTHAFLDVPVSGKQATYPVVALSPGAFPEQFTSLAEELASHGYIVVGINHEYRKLFPDGRIGGAKVPADLTLDSVILAGDISFVINQLVALNASGSKDLFAGHLDLGKLAVLGYSSSGGAVAIAASQDKRVQMVVSYDGDPLPPDYATLIQPYLFLTTKNGQLMPTQGPTYSGVIEGFDHLSFVDFPLWWAVGTWRPGPPPTADLLASMRPRNIEIVRAYTLAFLTKYVKGQAAPLVDGPSPDYPEVALQSRNVK